MFSQLPFSLYCRLLLMFVSNTSANIIIYRQCAVNTLVRSWLVVPLMQKSNKWITSSWLIDNWWWLMIIGILMDLKRTSISKSLRKTWQSEPYSLQMQKWIGYCNVQSWRNVLAVLFLCTADRLSKGQGGGASKATFVVTRSHV